MAVAANRTAVGQVLLCGITWPTYEAILADVDLPGTKLTYDRGNLEIMSPSDEHERLKKLFGRMVEAMTEELAIPIRSAGSTTFKSQMKERGLEPDESYYVANEPRVRGRDQIDLTVDPPPDLVIEVEITTSLLDRMEIYAALGVPEIWRFDGARLRVEQLEADGSYVQANGSYVRKDRSGAFPFLPLEELERFLDRRNATDETTWIRSFRDWVKGTQPRG